MMNANRFAKPNMHGKFHEILNCLIDASPTEIDAICEEIDKAFANEQITTRENDTLYKLVNVLTTRVEMDMVEKTLDKYLAPALAKDIADEIKGTQA